MALRALELDPNLSEAHTSLGWISNFYDWDWEGARDEFNLAIELDPQYATSHEWYALSLATRGKMWEAEKAARLALENDPLSLIINSVLGVILLFSRRFPEAIDQLNKTLEMDENFLLAHIWMGESYMFNKQYERAIASMKKACVISPDMTYALCNLGMAYGLSGQTGQAEAVLDSFDEIAESRHVSLVQKAQVCIVLGRLDQALEMLREAYKQKDPFCLWLKSAPHLDPLRSKPGFVELLQKIGLAE